MNFTLGYSGWGGTYIRGLSNGWLESASMSSNILTTMVNGSAGTGTLYVDCTGRAAPLETSGFDTGRVWYTDSTKLLWGEYTLASTQTITLRWAIGGGGDPGGGGGGTTLVNVNLADASVTVDEGGTAIEKVSVSWTGAPGFFITGVRFFENEEWFRLLGEEPLRLENPEPIKSDTFDIQVKPPLGSVGNYTYTYELELRPSAGGSNAHLRANGRLQVNVNEARSDGFVPPPASGPVPNAVGVLLGIGLVVGVGIALWQRREPSRNGSGRLFS